MLKYKIPQIVTLTQNKYTLRTWQTEDAHSLVQELNNKNGGWRLQWNYKSM